jgi:hypothetical protein
VAAFLLDGLPDAMRVEWLKLRRSRLPVVSLIAFAFALAAAMAGLFTFTAQILATLGYGAYYPWSVPALYSGLAGPDSPTPAPSATPESSSSAPSPTPARSLGGNARTSPPEPGLHRRPAQATHHTARSATPGRAGSGRCGAGGA